MPQLETEYGRVNVFSENCCLLALLCMQCHQLRNLKIVFAATRHNRVSVQQGRLSGISTRKHDSSLKQQSMYYDNYPLLLPAFSDQSELYWAKMHSFLSSQNKVGGQDIRNCPV